MIEIEMTTGRNGYPRGLHKGYVGFSSYEEARQQAERTNGEVEERDDER